MPQAAQSNIPYGASNYTAMAPGNVYKGAIDANSAIASIAGSLYVYPNSPAGLSVLVDTAFNLTSPGGGGSLGGFVLFNTAASPVTVALTAPTGNSYYATIYWNPVTNAAGVVYGATSATPFPILPDDASFIPLAVVLLTVGQLTVTASSIYDIRSFWSFRALKYDNITMNSAITVNCAGATAVILNLHSTGSSVALTLSNLQVGIPLQIENRAAANAIPLTMTTPGGVTYTQRIKTAGATSGSFNTFVNLGAGITGDTLQLAYTYYRGTTPFWDGPYQ